jgi:peptidoglycan/LPS O-acetylase OafA/YrhL
MEKYRPDIDGLRAFAVLAVVIFHAFPTQLPGGYIGVDVFFVVSGFLISQILIADIHCERFSIVEFYKRRIRRIFPALLVVFIFCLVFGWYSLFPEEYLQLGKHVAGGAAFVSNFILWSESGYFDNSADTKPLLHLWSLGIEEQFYFLWPVVIFIIWKFKLNPILYVFLIAIVSFMLNIYTTDTNIVKAFFFPYTRFWELLVGSLLALLTASKNGLSATSLPGLPVARDLRPTSFAANNVLSIVGACILVLGVALVDNNSKFPGFLALFPVLGSALIIQSGAGGFVNRYILSNRPVVWIGLISYPLYLWHWPLLSFGRILDPESANVVHRVVFVGLAFGLAALTYYFVECPIRYQTGHRGLGAAVLAGLMITVGGAGLYVVHLSGLPSRMPNEVDRTHDVELSELATEAMKNCREKFPDWTLVNDNPCLMQLGHHKSIAVVGDSHAAQLFFGLQQFSAAGYSVVDFPASCAAPFIDVITGMRDVHVQMMRKNNYKLINESYNYIIHDPDVEVVILAHSPLCSYDDASDAENPYTNNYVEVLRQGMRRSLAALFYAGKKVVIALDNPFSGFDPNLCRPRPLRLLSNGATCSNPRSMFDTNLAFVTYRGLIKEMQAEFPKLKVMDLSIPLCDGQKCDLERDGKLLYRDHYHLNIAGSEYVLKYYSKFIREMLGDAQDTTKDAEPPGITSAHAR